MREPLTPLSVVVGIDGSRSAVRAALWALDEAISRDVRYVSFTPSISVIRSTPRTPPASSPPGITPFEGP